MGKMTIEIPDELETQLRNSLPNKKGELGRAVTEGIKLFLKERRKRNEGKPTV